MEKKANFEILYELQGKENIFRIAYLNIENKGQLNIDLFEISIDKDKKISEFKIPKPSVRVLTTQIPLIKEKLKALFFEKTPKDYYRFACSCNEGLSGPDGHKKGCENVLRINYTGLALNDFEMSISLNNPNNESRRLKLISQIPISEIPKIQKSLDQIVLNHERIIEKMKNNQAYLSEQ